MRRGVLLWLAFVFTLIVGFLTVPAVTDEEGHLPEEAVPVPKVITLEGGGTLIGHGDGTAAVLIKDGQVNISGTGTLLVPPECLSLIRVEGLKAEQRERRAIIRSQRVLMVLEDFGILLRPGKDLLLKRFSGTGRVLGATGNKGLLLIFRGRNLDVSVTARKGYAKLTGEGWIRYKGRRFEWTAR